MVKKSIIFIVLFLLQIVSISALSQSANTEKSCSLNIGDKAPELIIRKWIKGIPIKQFEPGMIYVLEFWATWCKPCIAAMPHISKLADKYRSSVRFIGLNIHERKNVKINDVINFINTNKEIIRYDCAIGDSLIINKKWLEASCEQETGIPKTFIIDTHGNIAWIGHPKEIDKILDCIIKKKWDYKKEISTRTLHKRLLEIDDSLYYEVVQFQNNESYNRVGSPDSILLILNRAINVEPKIKYAPKVCYNYFSALIELEKFDDAFSYGGEAITAKFYDEPPFYTINNVIEYKMEMNNLPSKFFLLAAQAIGLEIKNIPYPEIANIPLYYHKMAKMLWLGKRYEKAIVAEKNAINLTTTNSHNSKNDLIKYKEALEFYESNLRQKK